MVLCCCSEALLSQVRLNDWITIIYFVNSESNPPVYSWSKMCLQYGTFGLNYDTFSEISNPKRKVWNCVSAAAKPLLSNVTNVGCVRPFSLSPTLGTTASSLACKPQTLTHTHTHTHTHIQSCIQAFTSNTSIVSVRMQPAASEPRMQAVRKTIPHSKHVKCMFANEELIHKYKQVQLAKSVWKTDKHARLTICETQNSLWPRLQNLSTQTHRFQSFSWIVLFFHKCNVPPKPFTCLSLPVAYFTRSCSERILLQNYF